MATTTTPDNIPAPTLTDPYALTQDMLALADGVQAALVRRANLYRGTDAQRRAFTTAEEGVHWQNTNGDKSLYIRQGGVWVKPAAGSSGGLVEVTVGTGNQIAGMNIYGAVVNVPVPYVAAPGEVIRVHDVARDPSWGVITQMGAGTVSGGVTNIPVRSIMFGASASFKATFAWDIINMK